LSSLEAHQLETEELEATDAEQKREAVWTRHLERLSRLTAEHPLRYLFFEVTRRCNLRCAYCGSSCDLQSGSGELDIGEWIEIARQIAADFEASRVMIAVTGGEPLMRPGLFELFGELRRLGFDYGIVTNGFYVNDRTAAELVAAGIGSISVSMDAPGEVNDLLRGASASAKAENAIASLRRAGYAGKLEIISTITRPVVPLLDTMRRRLSELRIANWRIAPVMPIGRAAEHPELIPGPVEIRQLLEYVREARADRMNPRPQFCEEGFVGNRFEGIVRPFLAQCRAGITTGGIRANGTIGACPELGDGFAQGHIRTERFRDVWETRYQVFRQRDWTKRGLCAGCEHHPRCNGGSLHLYPTPEAELLRCLYWMAREAEGVVTAGV
jgi:radical SAM protein with 4Fe4S-binding SPASM domain